MRVAIYARVSTDDKGQDTEVQLGPLRAFVTYRGWPPAREFVDQGWSGAKTHRPALDALMAAVRAREIDTVVVWRFDRFARSTHHLLTALDEFRTLGVDFVSQQESVDTSTPMGRMVFTFLAAIAEFEREVIRERVKAGMVNARSKGSRIGRAPLELDLRPAKAMLAQGHSLSEVAEATGISRRTLRRRLE